MEEAPDRTALLSALTTEHFVLQTANSATYTEAAARSSLYVMALSSSLVAFGFLADKPAALIPFVATVLPVLFMLGLFTVVRLVETSLESMHCLQGIARIRACYRAISPEAARHFPASSGRWPEVSSPAQRFGPLLAFLGTTASMIAVINSAVAGIGAALLVGATLAKTPAWVDVAVGIATTVALAALFHRYQSWRFADYPDASASPNRDE